MDCNNIIHCSNTKLVLIVLISKLLIYLVAKHFVITVLLNFLLLKIKCCEIDCFFSAKRRYHHKNLKDLMNISLQGKYLIEHSGPVFLLCFIEALKMSFSVYIYNIKIKDFCLGQYVIYGPGRVISTADFVLGRYHSYRSIYNVLTSTKVHN